MTNKQRKEAFAAGCYGFCRTQQGKGKRVRRLRQLLKEQPKDKPLEIPVEDSPKGC